MNKITNKIWVGLLGLVLCSSASQAAPLDFAGMPARTAAEQIHEKYGITLLFRGRLDGDQPITFTLADADAEGARLQAINALANALRADFQKSYVISKVDGDADVPAVKVDTNAVVVFPNLTLSTEDAVRRIAGVDNATAQLYGTLRQTVTMSALSLSAAQAAREVAEQTHTQWKVFYALTLGLTSHALSGRVIDRTSTGQPIIEEPYVYYRPTPDPNAQVAQATSAPAQTAPQTVSVPQGQMPSYANNYPYGFYSNPNYYGFNPYAGNNPYSQNLYVGNGYGVNPYGGTPMTISPGVAVSGDNGFGAPIVFGGGY